MIDSLINALLEKQKIPNLIKSLDTSFIVFSSGNYRSKEKSRLVIFVFQNSEPAIIIKFYKSNNPEIFQEYEIQKNFYNIYNNLISEPLLCDTINGFDILLEKPIIGKNFNRYFYENLDENSIKNSLKLVLDFHKKLNLNLELSNLKNLIDEVTLILEQFYTLFPLENHEIEFIQQCKSIFLKYFEEKNIFQRFSNHDFISQNFILSNNHLILIDFEFAKKTTLYFFEWFQFFKYQWSLSTDYIHDLLISETDDIFFQLALQEFSKYKKNDEFSISCRLIFELQEFLKHFTVFSNGSKQFLKKDMKVLINELKYRFENPNIISDPSKTKELYDVIYGKLTDYKQTSELNFLKNSLNETKSYFETALKDKNEYYQNALKDKDEVIKHHENALKDYKSQINEIKNSRIWKVVRLIDKFRKSDN